VHGKLPIANDKSIQFRKRSSCIGGGCSKGLTNTKNTIENTISLVVFGDDEVHCVPVGFL